MTTLVLSHSAFLNHDTGSMHPERADRLRAIDKVLAHELFSDLARAEAPLRDDDERYILKAHSAPHLEEIRRVVQSLNGGSVHIDADTVVSPGSWEAARRAVGAGMAAVDAVMSGKAANVFCEVRPPGHHAERERAMGFCLFSNAAIAAHYARDKYGLERVAVVDFDVHHGNGTQDIFWSDKDLFYGSTHQMPLFPGTGAVGETGVGNIFNAPLRAGDDGEAFAEAYKERILDHLDTFKPDLIIVSAGFDAHERDPLGGLKLVEADFLWATEQLTERAARYCDGRIVSMLEGGYDLTGLARSVAVHVSALQQAGD